jgi:hypothetical protein
LYNVTSYILYNFNYSKTTRIRQKTTLTIKSQLFSQNYSKIETKNEQKEEEKEEEEGGG